MATDRITTELTKRLLTTSKELLVHSLEHALAYKPTENDILQTVVNLQAALELLSKHYVVCRDGWQSIVDPKHHAQNESQILDEISSGSLKTIPFWKAKELAFETLYLNEDDVELLSAFQSRRNQLMHLGFTSLSHDILNEAIWFLVRIINQLEWKWFLPVHQQFLSNSLKHAIGDNLYKRLTTNTSYVGEAVDRAYELYSSSTTYCLECGNEALIKTEHDDYLCFVCGFEIDTDAMGLIDCPICKTPRALAYDSLNIDINQSIKGKCGCCRAFSSVSRCKTCHVDHITEQRCPLCY